MADLKNATVDNTTALDANTQAQLDANQLMLQLTQAKLAIQQVETNTAGRRSRTRVGQYRRRRLRRSVWSSRFRSGACIAPFRRVYRARASTPSGDRQSCGYEGVPDLRPTEAAQRLSPTRSRRSGHAGPRRFARPRPSGGGRLMARTDASADPSVVRALVAPRDFAWALSHERIEFALVEYVDGTFVERKDGETRVGFNGPAATSMPLTKLDEFVRGFGE